MSNNLSVHRSTTSIYPDYKGKMPLGYYNKIKQLTLPKTDLILQMVGSFIRYKTHDIYKFRVIRTSFKSC